MEIATTTEFYFTRCNERKCVFCLRCARRCRLEVYAIALREWDKKMKNDKAHTFVVSLGLLKSFVLVKRKEWKNLSNIKRSLTFSLVLVVICITFPLTRNISVQFINVWISSFRLAWIRRKTGSWRQKRRPRLYGNEGRNRVNYEN